MSSCKPGLILFVVGMHRSGTSALCAALAACGVSSGEQLIDPMAGVNDEGFWEDAGVVAVNEQLLALADSSWYAPADALADIPWDSERFAPQRAEASSLLRAGFGDGAVQAVTDPRLSQLGEEHSHALQTLRERDAELAWIKQRLGTISKVPGVGYLIRRMRKHAQG